ncbi:MAG: hypothetical protein K9J13_16595 [Saprospiraceae bacterium]|nr:hypothetical protein [Saprospiraceae bacterium]
MKHFIIILLFPFTSVFGQSVELIDYTLYPCDKDEMVNLQLYQKRIIEKHFLSDTLVIKVTTVMNCCSGEKGSATLLNDTIKLLSDFSDSVPVYGIKGDTIGWKEPVICDCECCFTIEYKIKGVQNQDYKITINGELIDVLPNKYIPESYKIVDNDTLFFHDNNGYMYSYTYYKSGKVRSVRKQKYPYYYWKTYYENGQLKTKTEFYKDFDNAIIKEYDEKGNLINQENNNKQETTKDKTH